MPTQIKRIQSGKYAGHIIRIDMHPNGYLVNHTLWLKPGAGDWGEVPEDIRRVINTFNSNGGYGDMHLIEFVYRVVNGMSLAVGIIP